ncbi:MAG: type II toxin-antitoxin system HicB family antitoxin [Desulfobia sp.]
MKYKVILEYSEEGYAVSVPGLPGCHSQGNTEQEAIENIRHAIMEYLEVVNELVQDKPSRDVEIQAI